MKKLILFYIILISACFACTKDDFITNNDLSGTWIEHSDRSYQHKLIFKGDTLYVYRKSGIDKTQYTMESKDGVVYLYFKAYTGTDTIRLQSTMTLNKDKTVLMYKAFYPYIVRVPQTYPITEFRKVKLESLNE